MKLIIVGGLLLFFTSALCQEAEEFHETEEEFEKEFGIKVNDDELEKHLAENLNKVEEEINKNNEAYKAGDSTFTEKLYYFSNLDKEDFEKMMEGAFVPDDVRSFSARRVFATGLIPTPESEKYSAESEAYLRRFYNSRQTTPDSYNAVEAGIVTAPKHQGQCGSCAAFSATGLHETCMIKAGASMSGLDLSEQQLVDCGYDGSSMLGCSGAGIHNYQNWFKNNGGQGPHENDQPYLGTNPTLTCPNIATWNSGSKVNSVSWDYSCNEEKMKQLVSTHGAVSIALYASDTGFSNYASGVFQGCSSTSVNHGVLLVGYGEESGVPYWLIKNSWGTSWGDGGYMKIKRGSNECGIEGICVVADCVSTDESAAPTPPAPTPTPAPEVPNELKCDVSNLFGTSDLNGLYTLEVKKRKKTYISEVNCTNSICTPVNGGVTNACEYICGKTTC